MRAIMMAALALLLLIVSVRSGLSPAAALLFALLSVAGARSRFFLRPELVTLLVVPAVVWLFLRRERAGSSLWLAWLALLMVIGANAHGGVLVVPDSQTEFRLTAVVPAGLPVDQFHEVLVIRLDTQEDSGDGGRICLMGAGREEAEGRATGRERGR